MVTRSRYLKAFEQAYASLNPEQKSAVDSIEGPVMVIAGPGTGKTQILALRIGRILQQTDVAPSNILCLTYTDAGAIAMRQRLLDFIGPEAYKVHVHTFHSFCNQVIQDNQEIFTDYMVLHHASDLEKANMFMQLIDSFDYSHPLRKLKGQLYYEARRMDKLFSLMKRESISAATFHKHIRDEYDRIEADPSLFYKRATGPYKVGDPKANYGKKKKRMALTDAAVEAFEPFQQMMQNAGRYDFDDMIHWVLNAFRSDEDLKAMYQEQFQYLLVDEYQDTNGSQNLIVQLLCDYWERPNLFVVGDDDQAIFRFQGANIDNLTQLYRQYTPQVVVLRENYRSTQNILDHAMTLINRNLKRLTTEIPGVEKQLIAQSPFDTPADPVVHAYLNVAQEEAAIFSTLKKLHQEDVPLNKIAVIYRKHIQGVNLIKALSQEGIPVDVKQRINILFEPLVRNLETILTYLQLETEKPGRGEHLLFEIMHYRFFDLPPVDIAKLSMHCWRNKSARKSLRQTMKDIDQLESLDLTDIDSFLLFNAILEEWIGQMPHLTIQVLLERVLKQGKVFREVMKSPQRTYQMQVLGTFFNYLKAETSRNPKLSLKEFLSILQQMREIELPLYMHSLMRSKDGVNFMTAHGAKGLEFDYVFIIGCNHRHWRSVVRMQNSYSLPSALVDPSSESDIEDERRLFYVAMTRARKHLAISYVTENLNGTVDEPTQFISEMLSLRDGTAIEPRVLPEQTISYYERLIHPNDKILPLIDDNLIDDKLKKFQLTPTALNKYLECPRTFYFEEILRVPLARSPYLGFGNAVHFALQKFLEKMVNRESPTAEELVKLFQESMAFHQSHFTEKEYENYLQHGASILTKYVKHKLPHWSTAKKLVPEKNIDHAEHRGVPVRGRLDLIQVRPDDYVEVTDFKTGNPDNGKSKLQQPGPRNQLGGNYWRQIVFYKILVEESRDNTLHMSEGQISFVEPDKYDVFAESNYLIDVGQYEMVSDQIVEAYQKISDHIFDIGCDSSYCDWCRFIKNDFVLPDDTFEKLVEPDSDFSIPIDADQMEFDF
ncbi:MAG: ATP-dependent helicase [Saprospiraceae bacterium]|nr:ATP-dependent helicase [Saprospiraceae bacterium]